MLTPEDTSAEARRQARRRWILLGVAGLAIAAVVWLNWRRADAIPQVANSRNTSDFIVTWRCLACAHTERDNAGPGPKTCRACGEDQLYASIRHACSEHGTFPVAFQYDAQGDPTEVNVDGAGWVPAADEDGSMNVLCPKCGHWLMPAERPDTEP